jgi:hypothetical protein
VKIQVLIKAYETLSVREIRLQLGRFEEHQMQVYSGEIVTDWLVKTSRLVSDCVASSLRSLVT